MRLSWLKMVMLTLGLSLGGAAIASGPARPGRGLGERIHEQRELYGNSGARTFELAKARISQGRALRARGEALREQARRGNSVVMGREASRLIGQGEALERSGRLMLGRIRM